MWISFNYQHQSQAYGLHFSCHVVLQLLDYPFPGVIASQFYYIPNFMPTLHTIFNGQSTLISQNLLVILNGSLII